MLGLTWDCVDISPEAIKNGKAYIYINKESQRVNKDSINFLESKDVILTFPSDNRRTKTVRVLKTPKTESSVRKIYLPRSVAEMLVEWRNRQLMFQETLGSDYINFNLVFCSAEGLPLEESTIRGALQKLIKEHNLPPVVFHSFRHSSVTYKLKLNGGDIKAVQGDSGHSQTSMVADVYSHIIDDDRRKNAELFENAFYKKKDLDPSIHSAHEEPEEKPQQMPEGVDAEMLAKVLANPDMVALLTALAKNMK